MHEERKTTKPEVLAEPYGEKCYQESYYPLKTEAAYPEPGKFFPPLEIRGTSPAYRVQVYLDNGVVFEYNVGSQEKVREHASAIVMGGYRHCTREGLFEHYPPHRILKVKSNGINTMYPDQVRGT